MKAHMLVRSSLAAIAGLKILRFALPAVLGVALGACTTEPKTDLPYFGLTEGDEHSIPFTLESKPRIALSGVLQRDVRAADKHERFVHTSGADLEALLASVSSGLSFNPALTVSTLPNVPVPISCTSSGSELFDMKADRH